jgi:hypothetical protein
MSNARRACRWLCTSAARLNSSILEHSRKFYSHKMHRIHKRFVSFVPFCAFLWQNGSVLSVYTAA